MEAVFNELKERANKQREEVEQYKNKVVFYEVLDELKHHNKMYRVTPHQIYLKTKYGLLYNYFLKYFI
jgi:hypothetical protein